MNRSRYVPQQAAYTTSQFQPFGPGPVPTPAQMPGMIPMGYPQQQVFGGSPNPNAMGASPILQQQQAMSPNAMWAANFTNGPIIEDLCAPPQMGLPTSPPPMNALPHRGMPMGAAMHPSSMPQVQNVFGLRQPGTPHPGHGFAPMMPGMPARMVGSYPPGYAAQPQGIAWAGAHPHHHQLQLQHQLQQQAAAHQQAQQQQQQQRQFLDPTMILGRPRMEGGGFASGGNGGEQMGSPSMGSSPAAAQPLTPVESTLQGFMSADSI
ncbi:hypothetical protein QBC40DRAFT_219203 [Triangularia verruculosa]|uniref:Uncharacterized protein n=1 Tax=Triangularia verruculosa TaxID=2587418 RepID=A0AAN7AYY0_9PEZI|nr:hypothetical protein QBC40DRAFT_219203 [Triangularia verruculosa]